MLHIEDLNDGIINDTISEFNKEFRQSSDDYPDDYPDIDPDEDDDLLFADNLRYDVCKELNIKDMYSEEADDALAEYRYFNDI